MRDFGVESTLHCLVYGIGVVFWCASDSVALTSRNAAERSVSMPGGEPCYYHLRSCTKNLLNCVKTE